jgi:hypothetical protein
MAATSVTFHHGCFHKGSAGYRRAKGPLKGRDVPSNVGWKEMRFYFHVIGAKRAYRDYEGLSCSNVDDARNHAGLMATELSRLLGDEFVHDARLRAISLLVVDERGNQITRMPLEAGRRNWRKALH